MLWVKAFHIIFVVSWYAGLLYLPRLFVYHAMADADDAVGHERFVVMERKLFGIMTVGLVGAAALGAWLAVAQWHAYASQGWLHAKFALVAVLFAFHAWCYVTCGRFRERRNTKTHRHFRLMNEVPALALVAIVVLAVVRPF